MKKKRRAVGEINDWIWPHWLERQLDPRSPAFVPRGHLPPPNITLRNWTTVGTVASPVKGIVDPRGLLTPWPGGWSLDWWILGEDRWHFPSREAAVRQQLVRGTPVVETAMRIPGGDAVQRVYAVAAPDPLAVMEITNRTPTPIAVAVSIRPYNPQGVTVVERIGLDDLTVMVDGRSALLLPRRPQGAATSTLSGGDVAAKVVAEDTAGGFPTDLLCEAGWATAAFVFSLAHTATLRVAAPLNPPKPAAGRRVAPRPAAHAAVLPEVMVTSDEAARAWQAQTTNRGLRLVLPEGRLASAIEANRRYLLLFHEGADLTRGPFTIHRFRFRDAVDLLGGLDLYGFHRESAEVLRSFPARQRAGGRFGEADDADANGAALHAMAEHWRLTGSREAIDAETVVRAARWMARKSRTKGRREDLYRPSFWALKGLLDAAALLRASARDRLAEQCEGRAGILRRDLETTSRSQIERVGADLLLAGARRGLDAGIIANLEACSPLGLFSCDDPIIEATAAAVRDRFGVGPAVYDGIHHTGLDPYLTLQLAHVELAAGDDRCLERLSWLIEAATSTYTWSEAIHPVMGGGCSGDGHDGRVAAVFLSFVRNLLVRESGGNGLTLCSMLPESWQGQNLEVHDAPTHFGVMSFAVRWHDERPALLWDLKARGAQVRITVPALDPSWSTDLPKGEALLAAAPGARPSPRRPPEPAAGAFR